jgi:hypothetical protein
MLRSEDKLQSAHHRLLVTNHFMIKTEQLFSLSTSRPLSPIHPLLSKKISDMIQESGKPVYFILNKVNDALAKKMATAIGKEQVIAAISFTAAVQEKGFSGESLDIVLPCVATITEFILKSQKTSGAKRQ